MIDGSVEISRLEGELEEALGELTEIRRVYRFDIDKLVTQRDVLEKRVLWLRGNNDDLKERLRYTSNDREALRSELAEAHLALQRVEQKFLDLSDSIVTGKLLSPYFSVPVASAPVTAGGCSVSRFAS